jgi:ABC-type proline/glycine betaine transport system ATPase subunit
MAKFRYDPEREDLLPLSDGSDQAKRNRTKFIVMKEGEIVFFGAQQELESSSDEYVKRFVRHED